MKTLHHRLNNEEGAILFTVVVFIIALTAAAVTLINLTTFELDMSRNYKCQQEAFFNGESGLFAMGKAISIMVDEGVISDANATGKLGGFALSQEAVDDTGDGVDDMDDLIEKGTLDGIDEGTNEGEDANETALTKNTTILGALAATRSDGSSVEATLDADANWYFTDARNEKGGMMEFASGYEGTANKSGRSMYYRIISQGHGCGNTANYTVSGQYRHVNR